MTKLERAQANVEKSKRLLTLALDRVEVARRRLSAAIAERRVHEPRVSADDGEDDYSIRTITTSGGVRLTALCGIKPDTFTRLNKALRAEKKLRDSEDV